MRLWSIHPKYLDAAGLVALWREALLAQKVLEGKTKGYKNHPQLERFKNHSDPKAAIALYLLSVYRESCKRGYCFDKRKIKILRKKKTSIKVKRGQLKYEFNHLMKKAGKRKPELLNLLKKVKRISPNPIFKAVKGGPEKWEKIIRD